MSLFICFILTFMFMLCIYLSVRPLQLLIQSVHGSADQKKLDLQLHSENESEDD